MLPYTLLKSTFLTVDNKPCVCRNYLSGSINHVATIQHDGKLFLFPDTMVGLNVKEDTDTIVKNLLSTIGWTNVHRLESVIVTGYWITRISNVLIFKDVDTGKVSTFNERVNFTTLVDFINSIKKV